MRENSVMQNDISGVMRRLDFSIIYWPKMCCLYRGPVTWNMVVTALVHRNKGAYYESANYKGVVC